MTAEASAGLIPRCSGRKLGNVVRKRLSHVGRRCGRAGGNAIAAAGRGHEAWLRANQPGQSPRAAVRFMLMEDFGPFTIPSPAVLNPASY